MQINAQGLQAGQGPIIVAGKVDYHASAPAAAPTPLPPGQNLPYDSLGSLFKGREEFLADLRRQLRQAQATVIRSVRAIHGMGGVGKTRAAVEYAWAHGDYRARLFVIADSPEALDRNFAALCAPGILDLPEHAATEAAVQFNAVLRRLNQDPSWLLILDNVDSDEAQQAATALLNRLPAGGHVILTSRLAEWPAGIVALDLDVLSPDSAIAFLLERTQDRRQPAEDDPATAARIAEKLDHLALALEQAAAYVRQRRCPLGDYLEAWERNAAAVLEWHRPEHSHYPRSVAVTYETSVARISSGARELFHILAWLAPDPFPRAGLALLRNLPDADAALIELTQFHLVKLDSAAQSASVHRLLQEITRQQQTENPCATLSPALAWVNEMIPNGTGDVRTWPRTEPWLPHAIAIATFAADRDIAEPTTRLLNQVAVLFQAQANYRGAEPLMRRALAIDEASLGAHHPRVAVRLNNLAQLLKATNRLADAEPLMRRALAIDEVSFGPDHPEVAIDLNNLAQLLKATNRLADAELLMRRALAIDEVGLGPDHPEVAVRLNNLAVLLRDTNRLADAEPLMRRALAIDEVSLGPDHPKVAIRLNNLAVLLRSTDRLADAESMIRRALAIDEASLGPDHPKVATSLNNLAQLLQSSERFTEAEPLMRRALAIDEASFGPNHPNVARDFNNLARLLQITNRLVEAEPLMRAHVEILLKCTRATGHMHPRQETALKNYRELLRARSDDEAQIDATIQELITRYGVTL